MSPPELEDLMPLGVPASRRWLRAHNLSASRLDNALKSGKLALLATGVYLRKGLPLQWEGVVYALQREQSQVVLGGLTAMDLLGRGHYLKLRSQQHLDVYAPEGAPAWLRRMEAGMRIQWRRTTRLWSDSAGDLGCFHTRDFAWRDDLPPLKVATAERALLELLAQVPGEVSFELADNIVQGLTNLSPMRLAALLHCCRNVKAKRLFFWFAQRHDYSWAAKLNVDDFDLGSGKRLVAAHGRLDRRLNITVPEAMYGEQ